MGPPSFSSFVLLLFSVSLTPPYSITYIFWDINLRNASDESGGVSAVAETGANALFTLGVIIKFLG